MKGVKELSDKINTPTPGLWHTMAGNGVIRSMFGYKLVFRSRIPLGGRLLSAGMVGQDVHRLQQMLAEVGLYEGVLDGKFGVLTEEAVIQTQLLSHAKADGKAGPELLNLLKDIRQKGLWFIHRVREHETLHSIAKLYGVEPGTIRAQNKAAPANTAVLLPQREIWLLNSEWRPSMECSGILVPDDASFDREVSCSTKYVISNAAIPDYFKKRRPEGARSVLDCRGVKLHSLRQVFRKCLRLPPAERPWIWLEEQQLNFPGFSVMYKINAKPAPVAGLILSVMPPLLMGGARPKEWFGWRRELRSLPVMLHLDLWGVLETREGHRRISPKEARVYLTKSRHNPEHLGGYGLAFWKLDGESTETGLWLPDRITVDRVLGYIVRSGLRGAVFGGVNSFNLRSLERWRSHFVLKQFLNT